MSKKKDAPPLITLELDPMECPFREFRDNEISSDLWGMGPAALKAATQASNKLAKPNLDILWVDEQTQPLPRSARKYLDKWIRPEEFAAEEWNAEVLVYDENEQSKMSVMEMQLTYPRILKKSSFCRMVMSACFILERAEGLAVEHQWENFVFSLPPEGWRPKLHIYSPGMKHGGGIQHRPGISKNGCYMVRLFYLGAWRCVWVSDQIPVDAADNPLLPFAPLVKSLFGGMTSSILKPTGIVYLWPLLLCKALLKLAVPNMDVDDENRSDADEAIPDFDVFHALTGCLSLHSFVSDYDETWTTITSGAPMFAWDEDDTPASTVKSKSVKKPSAKEVTGRSQKTIVTLLIEDTKKQPPFLLPGLTPAYEMNLVVFMTRDLPLKKPLPEPELVSWKYYRWVDWAKSHGLYAAYECPRTKFIKVNGLMKLSYAPHLLDVGSSESIRITILKEAHLVGGTKKVKETGGKISQTPLDEIAKEDVREWMEFDLIQKLIKRICIHYYPSMYEFTTACSNPPLRNQRTPNKALDILASKYAPLYLQIDGPEESTLMIALTSLHPRIIVNSGVPLQDYVEPSYFFLEQFNWFEENKLPIAKACLTTRGYDSLVVKFESGRHYSRLWIHSTVRWYLMLISNSTMLLGGQEVIQSAACMQCPWAADFLNNISASFNSWMHSSKSMTNIADNELDFFRSYKPDLIWDSEKVGYHQSLLHWMFRQALQSLLSKKLPKIEFDLVCQVLRYYFCDPEFGMSPKPRPSKALELIADMDPCDCVVPEAEEMGEMEELTEEEPVKEELKPKVPSSIMVTLLSESKSVVVSPVCDLATEELPCGLLREERRKVIRKHRAATILQANWRGAWARLCLNQKVVVSAEYLKYMSEAAFGSIDALSALMNEFFVMYPGAKSAYSVSSALTGLNGLFQQNGITYATPNCKWVPFFQGLFFCHTPVKVHFSLQSSLQHCIITVYDNASGRLVTDAFNTQMVYNFSPNTSGYTVMGHESLNQPLGITSEIQWHLTIMSSINGAFHCCDNQPDSCAEVALQMATKLHVEEIFIPNRKNIIGGIQVTVSRKDVISFRAASSSADMDLVATLSAVTMTGEIEYIDTCKGRGEIYWPYVRLKPFAALAPVIKKKCVSVANVQKDGTMTGASPRSLKSPAKNKGPSRGKSQTTLKSMEPKQYTIEVSTPNGWPLTVNQWRKVIEARNTQLQVKEEGFKKNIDKEKISARDKNVSTTNNLYKAEPDDAYIELECGYAIGGGAAPRRDDTREKEYAAVAAKWEDKDPGRNSRGALIRHQFRMEHLEAAEPSLRGESMSSERDSVYFEGLEGENKENEFNKIPSTQHAPSPTTESGLLNLSIEGEEKDGMKKEEEKYFEMPDLLRDNFMPLDFLTSSVKLEIESVTFSSEMAAANKLRRLARVEAGFSAMKEFQNYNEDILRRQNERDKLIDTFFVDGCWNAELEAALEERDGSIANETMLLIQTANKKKLEEKSGKLDVKAQSKKT